MPPDVEYLKRMQQELNDRGKMVEAGWLHLRVMSIPLDAPQAQVDAMRCAFFMGASHMLGLLGEVSVSDAITEEVRDFMRDFSLRYIPPGGSG